MRFLHSAVAVLLFAASAAAQYPAEYTSPTYKPATPSSTQPGHPLDPYDVYVLTGQKAQQGSSASTALAPQMYYSTSLGESRFSDVVTSSRWNGLGFGSFGRFRFFDGRFSRFAGSRFFSPRRFFAGGFFGSHNQFERHGYAPFVMPQSQLGGSQFNGSQFADVTTSASPNLRMFTIGEAGFRPKTFFGNETPVFTFTPRRFPAGNQFQGFTAPVFSPGRRP